MVDVVPRLDDQPVADPEDDDARRGPARVAAVSELADDHLRVGSLVNAYVLDAETRQAGWPRRGEVLRGERSRGGQAGSAAARRKSRPQRWTIRARVRATVRPRCSL